MAQYEFTEAPGGVGLEVIGADRAEVINAAATALCLFHWDQQTVRAERSLPVAWYGFNTKTAIMGLLSELLFRAEVEQWVFQRFVVESVEEVDERDEELRRKQVRISGTVYGEPFDAARHRLRFPIQAVLLEGLRYRERPDRVMFRCVLDA